MTSEQVPVFPATLDLRDNGGAPTFEDFSALREWLQHESDSFKWVATAAGNDSGLAPLAVGWKTNLRGLVSKAGEIANQPVESQANQIANLLREMERVFVERKALHSASEQGAFVLALRAENEVMAAGALSRLLGNSQQLQHIKAIEGMVRATIFLLGLEPAQEGLQRDRLASLESQWTSVLKKAQDRAAALVHDSELVLGSARESNKSADTETKDLIANSRNDIDAAVKEVKKKLEDFQRTISDAMALRAPVEYWKEKEKRHGWGMFLTAILAIGVAALSSFLLYQFGEHLLDKWGMAIGKSGKQVSLADVPLSLISTFLLGVLIFVWCERIMVRIFLSHVHLRTDAAERVVMAKTYLALLKEGAGPKDEDRALILTALFRHSQTGVVTDDAAPPIWDLATRQEKR